MSDRKEKLNALLNEIQDDIAHRYNIKAADLEAMTELFCDLEADILALIENQCVSCDRADRVQQLKAEILRLADNGKRAVENGLLPSEIIAYFESIAKLSAV